MVKNSLQPDNLMMVLAISSTSSSIIFVSNTYKFESFLCDLYSKIFRKVSIVSMGYLLSYTDA
jgi:hypothetical protein